MIIKKKKNKLIYLIFLPLLSTIPNSVFLYFTKPVYEDIWE